MENISSREEILARVRKNKPGPIVLLVMNILQNNGEGNIAKLSAVLDGIGGKLFYVNDWAEIISSIKTRHTGDGIIYSPIPVFQLLTGQPSQDLTNGHELANVEVGIIKAHFAVAEIGAVWVTNHQLGHRVLPFICQHLAVVINEKDVLPTMHDAYERNAILPYQYGVFIAGASKTADIEQSLVLGAHGPRSMMLFIMRTERFADKM